NFKRP
ncbi:hypothetical protein D043_1618B, partial [Vibrio parahaemolyticus EKP-021]